MVDYKYADLYKQDSVDKQLNIAFDSGNITNSDIHSEEFELEESLCSESQLRFGSCEASMIKFRISNIFTPLKDKWLTVTETLNHNTDTPFQFGEYKVYSDTPTADRRYRDVVAYDKMYDIINTDLTEWYNSLFPTDDTEVTLKEFRTSLMTYLGVEQEDVTLVNDNMVIKKTIQPTQLAGKDVVSAICEINGCFGHIGRDGKFHYVFLAKRIQGLYPSNNLYPKDDLFPREQITNKIDKSLYIDCKYEDYLSQSITKLQIRKEENDIGVIYPGGTSTEMDNTYIVQDNFLIYGKSSSELNEIAQNLYDVISDTEYRPYEANVVGNPCLEVGDAIRLNTKYQIVESYILNRTLKGVQGLRDSFSADGEEYYVEKVNAFETQITQLKGKTNTLERNIEETKSTITDVEKGLQSQITQTAESITQTIAKNTKIWNIPEGHLETVKYFGYGEPQIENPEINSAYFDQGNGLLYVYHQTGQSTYGWVAEKKYKSIEETLSSQIKQTADAIAISVSEDGDILTNLTTDKNGISFVGNKFVVNTKNFELDENGNATYSGTVKSKSNIAETTISDSAITFNYNDTDVGVFSVSKIGQDDTGNPMYGFTIGTEDCLFFGSPNANGYTDTYYILNAAGEEWNISSSVQFGTTSATHIFKEDAYFAGDVTIIGSLKPIGSVDFYTFDSIGKGSIGCSASGAITIDDTLSVEYLIETEQIMASGKIKSESEIEGYDIRANNNINCGGEIVASSGIKFGADNAHLIYLYWDGQYLHFIIDNVYDAKIATVA